MQEKQLEILRVAESMVRDGGYNGFSFRQIAEAVGIKSASVHYYYKTKEDLAVALAQQYTERFITALGNPAELVKAGKDPIDIFIDQFRQALKKDKQMCLCGILGAEANELPESVQAATSDFFGQNIQWLTQAYTLKKSRKPADKALQAMALLEGGLVVSIAMGSTKVFEKIAAGIAR
jgi:TetR/AcrR family transcriptional repressor of nem operon